MPISRGNVPRQVRDKDIDHLDRQIRVKNREHVPGSGMDAILGVLANLGELIPRNDDDSIDRLNRKYTTFILIIFAILVSTKQYVGEPINCWVPAQFTTNHEEYTDKVCWVSNTYYLPFNNKHIPEQDAAKHRITYYQWIPMILLCQAILYYLPCLLWRLMSKRSGLNLKTVMDAAVSIHNTTACESRERTIRYLVNRFDAYLSTKHLEYESCWGRIKKSLSKRWICVFGRLYGNYLTFLYLSIKMLFILNAIGQLFLLNLFLGTDYHMYGVHIALNLFRGEDWRSSVRFPRVTLCDFEVRALGNVHKHTVQCVLPINLFNEKIFVFIWFWFVFVSLVTLLNFLHWLFKCISRTNQEFFIRRQLRALGHINRETEVSTMKFTRDYMRQDGVFIARLVAKNAGEIVAAEVIAGLWTNYMREHRLLVDDVAPQIAPHHHGLNMPA